MRGLLRAAISRFVWEIFEAGEKTTGEQQQHHEQHRQRGHVLEARAEQNDRQGLQHAEQQAAPLARHRRCQTRR